MWNRMCVRKLFYHGEKAEEEARHKSSTEVSKNKRELDRSKKRVQPIRGVLQVFRHSSTCRERDRFCLGWRVRRSCRQYNSERRDAVLCSQRGIQCHSWGDLELEETLTFIEVCGDLKHKSLLSDRTLHSASLDKHPSRVSKIQASLKLKTDSYLFFC